MSEEKFIIRCRAIIQEDNKLLVVRHTGKDYYSLPGGHLDFGESIKNCIEREIIEELGVKPEIGKLLYVNSFVNDTIKQYVEFFFEITNTKDFRDIEKLKSGTHLHELDEIRWVDKDETNEIRPNEIGTDFKQSAFDFGNTKFIGKK